MIRALPFVFALAVLMPGLAAAQQSCITPAGTCALSCQPGLTACSGLTVRFRAR